MKSLFDDNGHYNEDANKFLYEFENSCMLTLERWIRNGYSSRDIELIALQSVLYRVAMLRLEIDVKRHKE